MAYRVWIKARKGEGNGEDPVFTFSGGFMLTCIILNRILIEILPKHGQKITSRDFRASLAMGLARKGAKDSSIKLPGSWISRAYNSYIKRGLANSWRELKDLLSTLQI